MSWKNEKFPSYFSPLTTRVCMCVSLAEYAENGPIPALQQEKEIRKTRRNKIPSTFIDDSKWAYCKCSCVCVWWVLCIWKAPLGKNLPHHKEKRSKDQLESIQILKSCDLFVSAPLLKLLLSKRQHRRRKLLRYSHTYRRIHTLVCVTSYDVCFTLMTIVSNLRWTSFHHGVFSGLP